MKKAAILILSFLVLEYVAGQNYANNQQTEKRIDSVSNSYYENSLGIAEDESVLKSTNQMLDFHQEQEGFINQLKASTSNENILSMTVYPNPARSYVNISIPSALNHTYTLSLANYSGQVQWVKSVPHDLGLKWAIDIRNLSPGIYYLILQSPQNVVKEKLIVIN